MNKFFLAGVVATFSGTAFAADVFEPVAEEAVVAGPRVSGYVDASYVVDTLGHAEPVSWKVLKSTNAQFEAPARESIMKSVFKPARIKGAAVRQLVQQRLTFTIGQ